MTLKLNTWGSPIFIVIGVLLAVLYGCKGGPIHYYTLVPLSSTQPSSNASQINIVIDRISMPPQVDRPELVIRQANNGLAILDTHMWGSNLTGEFQNALINQLPPLVASKRAGLHLALEVTRFDSVPGQYALIETNWRLTNKEVDVHLECFTKLSTPSGNSLMDLVSAHQVNIAKLASLIEAAGRNGKC